MPIYRAIRKRGIEYQINWVIYLTVHRYPSRRGEYVFVVLDYFIHLLLLGRETPCRGFGSCSDLPVTFRLNIQRKNILLRNHLYALLHRDQRDHSIWDCLQYPVELISQSNNDTTGPRFINNMVFPHIWLS
jgi:hypothetical protein